MEKTGEGVMKRTILEANMGLYGGKVSKKSSPAALWVELIRLFEPTPDSVVIKRAGK